MNKQINIDVTDYKTISLDSGKTIEDLVLALNIKEIILGAYLNNEIVSLDYVLKQNCKIKLIPITIRSGNKIYISGLKFLFLVAIKEVCGSKTIIRLKHSIDKGIYTQIENVEINEELRLKIINKMKELVDKALPIQKIRASRKSTLKYFERLNETEKKDNYETYNASTVTLYKLLDHYDYFFSDMPNNTKVLKYFDITIIEDALVLRYPIGDKENFIPEYNHFDKIIDVFKEYNEWAKVMDVEYTSELNKVVSNGKIKEFIQLNEINQNERIHKICNKIFENKDKIKLVLIGGPSSSGKTTSSKKIGLYLEAKGLNPFIISVDDYYKDRENTPVGENGKPDYETLEALEVKLFNEHLNDLINGKEVIMPTYNFKLGRKEYLKEKIKLKQNDIIIIEGLHTMNEELTKEIEREKKFKIYASPFTPLGIDRDNHVSTIDLRLLRRLVRDSKFRGYPVALTLENWKSVRYGEEKYVFPYQNEADAIFNTALIYETGVLKTYAEPLLYSVSQNDKNYEEAKRLIDFLNNFFPIPSELVPKESLLREFIGGSYFE